ncbi:MAG TPA: hypothetical protein VGI40_15175 [Pirellulaceae bacterium]|jgi:hypothetical protein
MQRLCLFAAVVFGLLIPFLPAQDAKTKQAQPKRGTLKAVDADKGTVTITSDGKDQNLAVMPQTQIQDLAGQPAAGGLKNAGFKPGAAIMFRVREQDGKAVLGGIKLAPDNTAGQSIVDRIRQPPPKIDLSQLKPLTDMSPDERYKGFQGGLYPDGKNERPAAHTAAGVALAKQIEPLNKDGKPSSDGRIVLVTIGMSNTMQASSGLLRMAKLEKDLNPKLTIVNGANGGMTADKIQNIDGGRTYNNGPFVKYWEYVNEQLAKSGATPAQVQAAWLKEANPGPTLPFPDHAKQLEEQQAKILHIMRDRFPNLKLVYISSRIFGGWAKASLNPEPYAYESNYAAKWLVERQIKGDPDLNFDPSKGTAKAPWLSWGPYLWANGTTPRKDGFFYVEDDLREDDRTHESEQGQDKVGRELIKFFKTDPTSRDWFTNSVGRSGGQ